MELSQIIPHIEALVFASDKPLPLSELEEVLNKALGFMEDRADTEQIESALQAITEKYHEPFYPFEVVESGGGWQFLTKKEYHQTVAQLAGDKFLKKLSVASIETLSIIAYKQPVTKSEIELIRGVNCDYAVHKLLEKDLVVIAGRKEDAPGKPLIYTTSKTFMDYFGINSAEDLPRIQEVLNQEIAEATRFQNTESLPEETEEEIRESITEPSEESIEENTSGAEDDPDVESQSEEIEEEIRESITEPSDESFEESTSYEETPESITEPSGESPEENTSGAEDDPDVESQSEEIEEEIRGSITEPSDESFGESTSEEEDGPEEDIVENS